jgi:hypothetical protein
MDMVFDSVDLEQDTSLIFDDAPDIFVQFSFMFRINGCVIVFCVKYDVDEDLTVTCHSLSFLIQPLAGLAVRHSSAP